MSEWVLDASAVLAVIKREPGEDRVAEALDAGAVVSAVNLSEVVAKLAAAGAPEAGIRARIEALRLDVAPFDADAAFAAGLLIPLTRSAGLSLGDRACIALGQRLGLPVLTADAAWAGLDLGVEITVLR
ncbi:MAG: type II toxin-antitoxin system VapC family toxin [Chloroflexota bacterium]|nr:type II toxin-antitoxin system VapC family toxin [Chloroflexota bacterium]